MLNLGLWWSTTLLLVTCILLTDGFFLVVYGRGTGHLRLSREWTLLYDIMVYLLFKSLEGLAVLLVVLLVDCYLTLVRAKIGI